MFSSRVSQYSMSQIWSILPQKFALSVYEAFVVECLHIRGLLEKYPTFGREKETGLLGALDT